VIEGINTRFLRNKSFFSTLCMKVWLIRTVARVVVFIGEVIGVVSDLLDAVRGGGLVCPKPLSRAMDSNPSPDRED